jgi:hypothetical protein
MHIYQLEAPEEFLHSNPWLNNFGIEEVMRIYAEHVATKFSAECVNEALGNRMEVSNAIHERIEKMYKSIIWNS